MTNDELDAIEAHALAWVDPVRPEFPCTVGVLAAEAAALVAEVRRLRAAYEVMAHRARVASEEVAMVRAGLMTGDP